ncbi:hypothetical protein GALMADRAFT_206165 [Galerina marginata CBS 339.88]|uniref:Uncharacterized protein n=1 Tax=Galerina marginata (strain CBS 339.88) TaxID=685588 RepID=A0A067TXC3_GALM3|nr:hypothetical protein GALMADRAFT_206165 [Galerina marginata CBS 339.88]
MTYLATVSRASWATTANPTVVTRSVTHENGVRVNDQTDQPRRYHLQLQTNGEKGGIGLPVTVARGKRPRRKRGGFKDVRRGGRAGPKVGMKRVIVERPENGIDEAEEWVSSLGLGFKLPGETNSSSEHRAQSLSTGGGPGGTPSLLGKIYAPRSRQAKEETGDDALG